MVCALVLLSVALAADVYSDTSSLLLIEELLDAYWRGLFTAEFDVVFYCFCSCVMVLLYSEARISEELWEGYYLYDKYIGIKLVVPMNR